MLSAMSSTLALKSILMIMANPKGQGSLRLQEEERKIKEQLRSQGYGKVPINSVGATRPRDLQQAMLAFKPQIVHFSGHGTGHDGLVFEDDEGNRKLIGSQALANLFKLFSDEVECVVLNACYSKFQAEEIAQHIDYVIGTPQAIGDQAAIEFAVWFYAALGAGRSIEFAYNFGCNAIQLEGIPENVTPILYEKEKFNSESERSIRAKYILVLSGTRDEVNQHLVKIYGTLQEISGDASLTLQEIKEGSVKLFFEGSQEGFEQLLFRFREGQLTNIFGFEIQDLTDETIEEERSYMSSIQGTPLTAPSNRLGVIEQSGAYPVESGSDITQESGDPRKLEGGQDDERSNDQGQEQR